MLKYQIIKICLENITFQIGLKKFLWLKRIKTLYSEHIISVILTERKLLERFTKRSRKKQTKKNQKELRIEKVIKRKGDKLYVKWKEYDNFFNSWIDKKDIVQTWVNISLNQKL